MHGLEHSRHGEERKHRPPHRERDARSRSPYKSKRKSDTRRRSKSPPKKLPYRAQPLSKHDFDTHKQLFALYLDVQKSLDIAEIEEKEVKGRWKSFVGKWNQAELAEGWYDSSYKWAADQNATSEPALATRREARASPDYAPKVAGEKEESDDDFGPSFPTLSRPSRQKQLGPAVPNVQDLQLADEMRSEEMGAARDDLTYLRKQDRKTQKELLEELIPRADPGSRERQVEKKKEIGATVASFRDAKEGGDAEIPEADLLGDDGIEGFKKRKTEMERKKNERELRREAQLKERMAEREERMTKARDKESKTMDYLRELANARYGTT